MARCARCGAETKLFINEVPMCLNCDSEREPGGEKPDDKVLDDVRQPDRRNLDKTRQMLVAEYSHAAARYAASLKEVARAAGALEFDAYMWLMARCSARSADCASVRE